MAAVTRIVLLVFVGFLSTCVTSAFEVLLRVADHVSDSEITASNAIQKKTDEDAGPERRQYAGMLLRRALIQDWKGTLRVHFALYAIFFCVLLCLVTGTRLYYSGVCAPGLLAEALNPVYSYLCAGRKACLLLPCF